MQGKNSVLLLPAGLVCSLAWGQQGSRIASEYPVPTLQEAIYSAKEGDVLYATRYLPRFNEYIRVDRPLTIVGGSYYELEFDGPGYGRATLVGAQVLDEQGAGTYGGQSHPGIRASGFDVLEVKDSYIQATESGQNESGSPALQCFDGMTLRLVRSTFHASFGQHVHWGETCATLPAPPGVECPAGTVYAISSSFYGGGGLLYVWFEDACPSGPIATSGGGAGLRAQRVFYYDSHFSGGPGAAWWNHPDQGPVGPGLDAQFVRQLLVRRGDSAIVHLR